MNRKKAFKQVAESRNLTAQKLATQVGGAVSYWYGMLAGKRPFGERTARNIEDKLGLQRYSLDEPTDDLTGALVRLDSKERDLVESYRKLSKEARGLDLELDTFGPKRHEAYQLLLEHIEKIRVTLLGPATSPNAPSAVPPKKQQRRVRRKKV